MHILKHTILLFCLFTAIVPFYAQNTINDFTKPQQEADTAKVNRLNKVAYELRSSSPASSYANAQEAFTLATQIKYTWGVGVAYVAMGTASTNMEETPRAIAELEKGITICLKTGNLPDAARAYNNLGNIYRKQGKFDASIKNHLASIDCKKRAKNNTGIATSYNNLGAVYLELHKYDKAVKYFKDALHIRLELNDSTGIAQCHLNLATAYMEYRNPIEALKFQNKALAIYQKINAPVEVGETYVNIGVNYQYQGHHEEALKIYLKAIQFLENSSNRSSIAFAYHNIGAAYNFLGDYPKALEFCFRSLTIRKELGEQSQVAESIFNIAHIYRSLQNYPEALKKYAEYIEIKECVNDQLGIATAYNAIGIINEEQKNFAEAMEYYRKALDTYKQIGNPHKMAETLNNMGNVMQHQKQFGDALIYLNNALTINRRMHNKHGEASQLLNISNTFREMGDLKKATDFFQQGLPVAQRTGAKVLLLKYYFVKSILDSIAITEKSIKLTAKDSFWKNAYTNLKKFSLYKDSMFSKESDSLLLEMLTKYEAKEKENKITVLQKEKIIQAEELKRQKYIRNTIISIGLFLLFASLVIFMLHKRNRNIRQKQRETALSLHVADTEMKVLRAQMNPHFIFNAMQSVQNLLMQQRPDEADAYLQKFSKLLRLVLENSQYSEILLNKELEALELYMQLERLRFALPFTYNLHIDNEINTEGISVPPLILQPYVENALWHGIRYKNEPGKVDIYVSKKEDMLCLAIEDNGVGREAAKAMAQSSLPGKTAKGLRLTEERLQLINRQKKTHAGFTITDLYAPDGRPRGTRAELLLPYET